jgi:hypothetical protein
MSGFFPQNYEVCNLHQKDFAMTAHANLCHNEWFQNNFILEMLLVSFSGMWALKDYVFSYLLNEFVQKYMFTVPEYGQEKCRVSVERSGPTFVDNPFFHTSFNLSSKPPSRAHRIRRYNQTVALAARKKWAKNNESMRRLIAADRLGRPFGADADDKKSSSSSSIQTTNHDSKKKKPTRLRQLALTDMNFLT